MDDDNGGSVGWGIRLQPRPTLSSRSCATRVATPMAASRRGCATTTLPPGRGLVIRGRREGGP